MAGETFDPPAPLETHTIAKAEQMDAVILPQHEHDPKAGTRIVRNVWVIVFRQDGLAVKAKAELTEQWTSKTGIGMVVVIPFEAIDNAQPWNPSTDAYAKQ